MSVSRESVKQRAPQDRGVWAADCWRIGKYTSPARGAKLLKQQSLCPGHLSLSMRKSVSNLVEARSQNDCMKKSPSNMFDSAM